MSELYKEMSDRLKKLFSERKESMEVQKNEMLIEQPVSDNIAINQPVALVAKNSSQVVKLASNKDISIDNLSKLLGFCGVDQDSVDDILLQAYLYNENKKEKAIATTIELINIFVDKKSQEIEQQSSLIEFPQSIETLNKLIEDLYSSEEVNDSYRDQDGQHFDVSIEGQEVSQQIYTDKDLIECGKITKPFTDLYEDKPLDHAGLLAYFVDHVQKNVDPNLHARYLDCAEKYFGMGGVRDLYNSMQYVNNDNEAAPAQQSLVEDETIRMLLQEMEDNNNTIKCSNSQDEKNWCTARNEALEIELQELLGSSNDYYDFE